jgi:hypothetical protein
LTTPACCGRVGRGPETAYLMRGGKIVATFDTGDYRHLRVVLSKKR